MKRTWNKERVFWITSVLFILMGTNLPPLHAPAAPERENMEEVVKSYERAREDLEWVVLILALIEVESNWDKNAVGKTNDLGILQITPVYVKEVNRILGSNLFTLEDRRDVAKSLEMFRIYQNNHNPEKDITKAIKKHNPRASQSYERRVREAMERLLELIAPDSKDKIITK